MKVLVLGADGLLGHNVVSELASHGVETVASIRRPDLPVDGLPFFRGARIVSGVDLTLEGASAKLIDAARPDTIVNCAGIVKQRAADQSLMEAINAELPGLLARECSARAIRLVHISTDCVFSGASGAYAEHDTPDPSDAYGRSKERGERRAAGALILRTSFVGRELSRRLSLLEWCLSRNGGRIEGYSNAYFSGLTAPVAAREIRRLVLDHPEIGGICHLSGPRISKLELLRLVRDIFALAIEIVPNGSIVCDRTLAGDRYRSVSGFEPPTWRSMLEDLADQSGIYDALRPLSSEARLP